MHIIIILGQRDSIDYHNKKIKPESILQGRLDAAIEYSHNINLKTSVYFLVSGGNSSGPTTLTEAECMKKYLLDKNIPEEYIIEEDQSKHTTDNAKQCFEILKNFMKNIDKICVVSSKYHIPRVRILFDYYFNNFKSKIYYLGTDRFVPENDKKKLNKHEEIAIKNINFDFLQI